MRTYQAILFDLDGTLLPMDQDRFTRAYFEGVTRALSPFGHDPQTLISVIWKGTGAMVKNDGSRPNEEAFWQAYEKLLPGNIPAEKAAFERFYETDFSRAREVCGYDPGAAELIRSLKAAGFTLGLASNPIFPRIAQVERMRWAGVKEEDFAWITTYENASTCKPNPRYYLETARALHVEPEACLMVGNDVDEDMEAASAAGMDVFLMTHSLLNRSGKDVSRYPRGSFSDALAYVME